MSARRRIESAENAILFAKQRALSERSDPDHAAAVELESRGLLVDRAEVERELRVKLAAEIDAAIEELFHSRPDGLERRMGLRQAFAIVLLRNHPAADAGAQVIDGSPGDLFDEPSPVSVPPRAGERAAWRMARGESAVNQAETLGDRVSVRNVTWRRCDRGWAADGGWLVQFRSPVVLADGWYLVHPTLHRWGTLLDGVVSEKDALYAATSWVYVAEPRRVEAGDLYDPTDPAGAA